MYDVLGERWESLQPSEIERVAINMLEERIKILEALKEIIDPGEDAAADNDEALAANCQGDGLVYIPTPEEAEDIKKP